MGSKKTFRWSDLEVQTNFVQILKIVSDLVSTLSNRCPHLCRWTHAHEKRVRCSLENRRFRGWVGWAILSGPAIPSICQYESKSTSLNFDKADIQNEKRRLILQKFKTQQKRHMICPPSSSAKSCTRSIGCPLIRNGLTTVKINQHRTETSCGTLVKSVPQLER